MTATLRSNTLSRREWAERITSTWRAGADDWIAVIFRVGHYYSKRRLPWSTATSSPWSKATCLSNGAARKS
jgi:hypothetical protein